MEVAGTGSYPVSQKKLPAFKNSWHHQYCADLNDSNPSQTPKDRNIFVIFLAVLPVQTVSVNLIS